MTFIWPYSTIRMLARPRNFGVINLNQQEPTLMYLQRFIRDMNLIISITQHTADYCLDIQAVRLDWKVQDFVVFASVQTSKATVQGACCMRSKVLSPNSSCRGYNKEPGTCLHLHASLSPPSPDGTARHWSTPPSTSVTGNPCQLGGTSLENISAANWPLHLPEPARLWEVMGL